MKSMKLVLLLVLVVALAAVVLQNQAPWQVRFLWLKGEVPGIILLFLAAAAGFIAGLTVALLVKRDAKPHNSRQEKDMNEKELYQQKKQAQLDEWKAEVDKLKAKASGATADAQIELNKQIEALEGKIEEGKTKACRNCGHR